MEKVSLPIKTKIATWWMLVIGCLEVLISLFDFPLLLGIIVAAFSGLLLITPGFLLLERKKGGWWLAVIILLILLPSTLLNLIPKVPFGCFYFLCVKFFLLPIIGVIFCIFIFIAPLILLLLDRKNFWKIAT